MKLLVEAISRLKIDWNERPLTERDFYRLCRRHKVSVEEMPLRVGGFYYSLMGGHYIAIDSRLPPGKKLFVMFHEFAHFLLHTPDATATANFHGIGRRNRKENEADAFALCALIPQTDLSPDGIAKLTLDESTDMEMLEKRLDLLRRHGI
jgi:Zn-dependent peptidase ImmA (M78 family)